MSKKIGGLGRGLEAIFPGFDSEPGAGAVIMADIRDVDTSPNQPRKNFDKETLQELAHSIRQHGIVQPLLVKKSGERYVIIAGERRFRAARMAGQRAVPVLLSDLNEQETAEVALIENIQRENLNPIEEAAAISFLMRQHDLTQDEVAHRIGKSRTTITNSLRLLTLPKRIISAVEEGKIAAGHAKALAGISDEKRSLRLLEKTLTEGWAVHRLEEEIRGSRVRKARRVKKVKTLSADMREVLGELRMRYVSRIDMTGTEDKGKIIFSYYSAEELDRLYQLLAER